MPLTQQQYVYYKNALRLNIQQIENYTLNSKLYLDVTNITLRQCSYKK
jgi:hypothetical protein